MKQHLLDVRDSIQKMLLNDDELINGQTDEENPLFKCLWEDCDFVPVRPGNWSFHLPGHVTMFYVYRAVYDHTFTVGTTYVKSLVAKK